jgi:hypothetical protein
VFADPWDLRRQRRLAILAVFGDDVSVVSASRLGVGRLLYAGWLVAAGLMWIGFDRHWSPVVWAGGFLLVLTLVMSSRREAYARRLVRAGDGWVLAEERSSERLAAARQARLRALESLKVPAGFREIHEQLLSAARESTDASGQTGSATDQTAASIDRHRHVQTILDRIRSDVGNVDEQAYARQLDVVELAYSGARSAHVKESERALSEVIARAERLRPTERLTAEHASLCAAHRELFIAWHAYHESAEHLDIDAATRSREQVNAANAEIARLYDVILAPT